MEGKEVVISAEEIEEIMLTHEARVEERRIRNPNYQTTFAFR